LTSASHELERPSMTHSESPELTSWKGRRARSGVTGVTDVTGSAVAGSTVSGISAAPRPRHPTVASTRTAVNTRPGPNQPYQAVARTVLTLLLSLAACGGVNTGQSVEVPAPPEALLGHGFDSLSGLSRGACVEPQPVDRFEHRGANTVTQVFYARSKEEILRQIGFSGGISLGLSGFGLNLGFEALDRDVQQSTTTFAVIRIQIEAPSETLRDYRLADHAVTSLRREGADRFYEKCGDGFVAAIRQGGLFLGIVALDTVASDDIKRLSGSAGISLFGFGVQGGASRETRDFLEKHRARYYIVQNGGDPGGWSSVKQLESLDSLLQRAKKFEGSVASGRSVPTRLVVRPYQVASNLPRKASLWNVIEQRRFLDDLAIRYGEVKRASAELDDKLARSTCESPRQAKELEQLKKRYTSQLTAIQQRAQDCLNDPQRRCTDRGLDSVNARAHKAALELCATPASRDKTPAPQNNAPDVWGGLTPRPVFGQGNQRKCNLWQLTSLSAQPASRSGDSQLDTSAQLWVNDQKIPLPSPLSNPKSVPLKDIYLKPGARALVRVWPGPLGRAVIMKTWTELTAELPATLPRGTWTLEQGQAKVVFHARCVE
jgi:hypothetical protein